MQLKHLTLTHMRAFDQAEFTFQSGINLIVGINGVGKSTVLDALRILLSQASPKLSRSRSQPLDFETLDITLGQGALTAELKFELAETPFTYLVHQPRERYITDSDRADEVHDQAYEAVERHDLLPSEQKISKALKNADEQPLALYFSPRRALASHTAAKRQTKGITAAFADALDHRELRLMEFADWWLAQTALAAEGAPLARRHLEVLAEAVTSIIDTCSNVRAERETFTYQDKQGKQSKRNSTTLLIDKSDTTLDVRQLSDGERGMLALVLDLARRLSQANPGLDDPLSQGKAVVLIDELDLHLHPRWQRTIVQKLTHTFPNCQFIATTHSPLVIGEVEPAGLTLLRQEGDRVSVIQGGLQGFGLDSSWILEHLMGTDSRNPKVQAQINQIEDALEEGELDLARDDLDVLRSMIHGDDDEVIRLEASINNLEALADAVDTEEE
ncbi:MAG: AAA family ATPase [Cyanobacteria bacterium P01_C01_bin.121]